MVISNQVNENQLSSSGSNGHYSTSESNCVSLNEDVVLNALGVVFCMEFVKLVGSLELVRIWILFLVSHSLDPMLSVLCVLSRVEFNFLSLSFAFSRLGNWLCLLLSFLLSQLLSGLDLTIDYGYGI